MIALTAKFWHNYSPTPYVLNKVPPFGGFFVGERKTQMQSKLTDVLTAAGYTTSTFGLGVGTWFAHNWLAALSAAGILITIWFQYRQDRRQKRRLELLKDKDD